MGGKSPPPPPALSCSLIAYRLNRRLFGRASQPTYPAPFPVPIPVPIPLYRFTHFSCSARRTYRKSSRMKSRRARASRQPSVRTPRSRSEGKSANAPKTASLTARIPLTTPSQRSAITSALHCRRSSSGTRRVFLGTPTWRNGPASRAAVPPSAKLTARSSHN